MAKLVLMMTDFDNDFDSVLNLREKTGVKRSKGIVSNRTGKDFFSNDYLGLSRSPPVMVEKMNEWGQRYGIGSTGSPLVSGRSEGLERVERRLAQLKKKEDARIFSSGWQAIASLIPLFVDAFHNYLKKNISIIADKHMHASFYFGCRAAGVVPQRFRHNDMHHLQTQLAKAQPTIPVIFTESVFSMGGDRAPLQKLRLLATKYRAYLCVDEAHATGILGKSGAGEATDYADLIIGTFGKALGVMGAFVCGTRSLCALIDNLASGYIYSTSLSPAMLGAVDGALSLITGMAVQRRHVAYLAELFRLRLKEHSIATGKSTTHIVPVIIPDKAKVMSVAHFLKEKGFYVGAIRPPSVAPSASRLRVTFHAFNTVQETEELAYWLRILLAKRPS